MRSFKTPLTGLRSIFGVRQSVSTLSLLITGPMGISWVNGVATIMPATWNAVPDTVTYTATVDGTPVTITGLTFPAPALAVDRALAVTVTATKAGYSNGFSVATYTLAASIWDVVGQALQILINSMPTFAAPVATGGVTSITVNG